MTGSRFLLDTNIVIALFAGDAAVHTRLAKGADVFIPCIVIGELLFGARKSGRTAETSSCSNRGPHRRE
jgi:tRNA(fMet)-specific endonuclease VapC